MTFRFPPQSILLDANTIIDTDRTRQDYGDLDSLAESITSHGLIHPPVVDTNNRLIAGGRRLRAIRDVIKSAQIPVLVLETLDDAHLAILEAEENIRRKQPTWQERVLGVAKVHNAAKSQAIRATRKWTIIETGEMLGVSFSNVNNALTLARYIRAGDAEINKCATITDACKLLLLRREKEALAATAKMLTNTGVSMQVSQSPDIVKKLVESGAKDEDFFSPMAVPGIGVVSPMSDDDEMPGAAAASTQPEVIIPLSKMLHKGLMEELCYSVGTEFADHVITDIPYGINMSYIQQDGGGMNIDAVREEHDVLENVGLFTKIFPAVWNALKPNGYFIFFYDLDHHEKLHDLANKTGFSVQRWPLIWYKTHACQNMAASKNFTKNYECAMVCRKGNATLLSLQSSAIWAGGNDELKVQLGHPFVKPVKLWQWLYNAVALRGQTVLDPFAGVGSSTIAAIETGLCPVAFECNAEHYDRLVIHTANAFRKLNPNTKFT